MRLSISNIAWDTREDEEIAGLLRDFAVDAIDVAPGKYFPEPSRATADDIILVKNWWLERGIEIVGMQALLFGTSGLNVFGSPEIQDNLLSHLSEVGRISGGLGARYLVFGSPKNRDRTGFSDQETLDMAIKFFRRLGDISQEHGVIFCLEPNPTCYGANFMTTSFATADMVEQIDHPAIKMQLDTGAISINGEDPAAVLRRCAPLIGHIHASEPDLLPLGDGNTDHTAIFSAIPRTLHDKVVTIEMLAARDESHLVTIKRALEVAIKHYRSGHDGDKI